MTLQDSANPFFKQPDFWISTALSIVGLIVTTIAWWEARSAKEAAREAAARVKIQMQTTELLSIVLSLENLVPGVSYSDARDLLTKTEGSLIRIISPYEKESDLQEPIQKLVLALEAARSDLREVKPTDPSIEDKTNSVYFAMEERFSVISSCTANLIGLFENRATKIN